MTVITSLHHDAKHPPPPPPLPLTKLLKLIHLIASYPKKTNAFLPSPTFYPQNHNSCTLSKYCLAFHLHSTSGQLVSLKKPRRREK